MNEKEKEKIIFYHSFYSFYRFLIIPFSIILEHIFIVLINNFVKIE